MCVSVCVKIYPDAMQCKFSDEFRHCHVLQVLCVHLDKIWCWNNATICSLCPFGFMCFTCCSDKSVAAAQDLFPLVHSSANLQQNQEHFHRTFPAQCTQQDRGISVMLSWRIFTWEGSVSAKSSSFGGYLPPWKI